MIARRRERGQSMVEFALLAPVLFFMLLVVLDFGRGFLFMAEMDNAAREGARQAVLMANRSSNQAGSLGYDGAPIPGVLPQIKAMAPVGFPIVYADGSTAGPPSYGTYTANPDPTKPGKVTLSGSAVTNTAYVFIYELTPSGANWTPYRSSGSGNHYFVVVDIQMRFQPVAAMVTPGGVAIPLEFQTVEREE